MRLVIGASRGKSPETLAGEIVDLGWSEFGHTPSTHLVVDFRSIPAVTCCCVLFENPALQQRILPSRRTRVTCCCLPCRCVCLPERLPTQDRLAPGTGPGAQPVSHLRRVPTGWQPQPPDSQPGTAPRRVDIVRAADLDNAGQLINDAG